VAAAGGGAAAGPLTLVRPALAADLVVLVAIAHRADRRRIDAREWAAVAAIVAGVAGLAVRAPARTDIHAAPPRLASSWEDSRCSSWPLALRPVHRSP
jgi:hypothetical protein